jgi:hypothetical protein
MNTSREPAAAPSAPRLEAGTARQRPARPGDPSAALVHAVLRHPDQRRRGRRPHRRIPRSRGRPRQSGRPSRSRPPLVDRRQPDIPSPWDARTGTGDRRRTGRHRTGGAAGERASGTAPGPCPEQRLCCLASRRRRTVNPSGPTSTTDQSAAGNRGNARQPRRNRMITCARRHRTDPLPPGSRMAWAATTEPKPPRVPAVPNRRRSR